MEQPAAPGDPMGAAEHRRDPRVSRAFLIRYRCPAAGQERWLVSPLRDLSRSGARFLSERMFAVGVPLELQLVLPVSRQPVVVGAHVAWQQPGALGMVEMGVTFDLGADDAARRAVDTSVAHFLRGKARP